MIIRSNSDRKAAEVVEMSKCKCGGRLIIIGHVSRGSSYVPRWRCVECRALVGPVVCHSGGCNNAPATGQRFCASCLDEYEEQDARETRKPFLWTDAFIAFVSGAVLFLVGWWAVAR